MKKVRLFSLMLIIILSLSMIASGRARIRAWKVKAHRYSKRILKREITRMWRSGYIPVGLSAVPKERRIFALYVKFKRGGRYKNWSLSWYKSVAAIKRGITRKLKSGWIPMGMSLTRKILYVIYIKKRGNVKAWKLAPAKASFSGVKRVINRYARLGYVPTAISASKSKAFILLLKIPNSTAKGWYLKRYVINRRIFTSGITRRARMGYIPWGFMIRYNRAFVLFIK